MVQVLADLLEITQPNPHDLMVPYYTQYSFVNYILFCKKLLLIFNQNYLFNGIIAHKVSLEKLEKYSNFLRK